MSTAGGPPSCLAGGPGLSNCGATSIVRAAAPARSWSRVSTYYRTYANDGTGPTEESDPATVSTFRLDKYDVTVGRFRQFVNAVLSPDGSVGWTPAAGSGKHSHLNGGQGLANSGDNAGYEGGWALAADDDQLIAPHRRQSLRLRTSYATWTASAAGNENLPHQLRELVGGARVLHLGWGLSPERSRMGDHAGCRGKPAAGISLGVRRRPAPQANTRFFASATTQNGSGSCTGVLSVAPVGAAPPRRLALGVKSILAATYGSTVSTGTATWRRSGASTAPT